MAGATLTYFNGRGRAEVIRIALAASGVEYNEKFLVTREQFLEASKGWLFGQAPCLEINGLKIIQSGSILRYLAKVYKLNGTSIEEETLIDQYFEGSRDFIGPFVMLGFTGPEKDALKGIQEKTLPKYMSIYEKVLSSSGGSYLVGNKLSLADVGLLEPLYAIEDYLTLTAFEPYPHLKKYYQDILKTPWAQNYVKNYRKPKNTPEYVAVVGKTLGFA